MDLLLQDLAVTAVALGAALVLIRRVHGAVASTRKPPSCGSCPNCDPARNGTASPQART
jgi:hypothetical protein